MKVKNLEAKLSLPSLTAIFLSIIFVNYCLDSYLPSVPSIAKSLNTNISNIQFSFAITAVGMGFGTLIAGMLLTYRPRKFLFYISCVLGLIGEVFCFHPVILTGFIIGRIITGIAIGMMTSVIVTIVCDKYTGIRLAKINSILMMLLSLIPAISPFVGGHVETHMGWQYNFIIPLIMFSLITIMVYFFIPETFSSQKTQIKKAKISSIAKTFFEPLKDIKIVMIMSCGFISMGCVLSYLAIGPNLFQVNLKLTPVQYGGLAVYSTIAYISSAIINTKFIKYGFNKIMFPGAILSCLAAFAMIILYMIGYFNVLVIVLPFTIFLFAINLIQMNTLPLAITMYDKNKSSPAGLIIFVQTIFASILGIIASYLPAKNQFYLGVLMSISAIALLILLSIIFKKGTKI